MSLERNARQRERRAQDSNKLTRRYEKTPNGFLMRTYRNMQSRVTGIQSKKHHLYEGKTLLERQEFYEWSKASATFHALFQVWEANGYVRKLTPSIDRIDASEGYELSNIRWVTHSFNSANTRRWDDPYNVRRLP